MGEIPSFIYLIKVIYFLDEIRLNNFILDKLEILCYNLVTVKKGDRYNGSFDEI